MKLYEINAEILRLTDQIEFDPETGEVLCDIDAIESEISALQMEKKSILTWLAKLVLNTRAEAAAIKAEEERLKGRRDQLEKKEKRLMSIINRECAGEKTDLGVAVVSYRKSEPLEITDARAALEWLRENNHTECIKIADPEVRKSEVKALVKKGIEVPGAELLTINNCALK